MAYTKTRPKQIGEGCIQRVDFGSGSGFQDSLTIRQKPQLINCGVTYGDNIPGWRDRIKARQSATTSLSGNDISVSGDTQISGESSRLILGGSPPVITQRMQFTGDASSFADVPSDASGVAITSANNIALTKFVSKATEFLSPLKGLVLLGEFRQTVELFRRPVKRLRGRVDDLFRQAKRLPGDRGSKRRRKAAAALWLEWSFGVTPLVKDIQDGAHALANLVNYTPPSQDVHAVGRDASIEPPSKISTAANWIRVDSVVQKTAYASVVYRGLISTDFLGYRPSLAQFGLVWYEVLPAAWELIPYSFLIDYFSNVGDMIAGLSFPRASVKWVEKRTLLVRENELNSLDFVSLPYHPSQPIQTNSLHCGGGCIYSRKSFTRGAYDGSFIPSFQMEIPSWKNWKKWLNMAALVAQGEHVNGRPYRL